ncbi:MAG: hypothetical protein ABL959_00885 [Pyrinomonadaceae bacterium]
MNRISFALAIIAAIVIFPTLASAQRDYVTAEEIELIREAQEIDHRIDILVHAIDRRFAALKLEVAPPKRPKKDETWGALPTGTRLELLYDVKRILQKAIDDIDSLSERPDSAVVYVDPKDPKEKKSKGFAELFPKAVRNLAAAAKRYGPVLKAELDKKNEMGETGSILDSLEMCDEIIAAVAKLPAETKKSKE